MVLLARPGIVVADNEAGAVFSPIVQVAGNGERSALRGSLWWHVRGETINPQRFIAAYAIPLISLPLSGAQRTWPDLLLVRARRE